MSNLRNTDGLMTSSYDARQNVRNKTSIICRLKPTNKNVVVGASGSGDEVEDIIWFLKGGAAISLWSRNRVEVDCAREQENGWQNVVIVAGSRKRVASTTVRRVVDSQASGLNSRKAQHQRGRERVASAKIIRMKQPK